MRFETLWVNMKFMNMNMNMNMKLGEHEQKVMRLKFRLDRMKLGVAQNKRNERTTKEKYKMKQRKVTFVIRTEYTTTQICRRRGTRGPGARRRR